MKAERIRKFPGIRGRRPDRKARRCAEAVSRNDYFAGLSPARQLANLDARLGKDIGAAKQRARIAQKLRAV